MLLKATKRTWITQTDDNCKKSDELITPLQYTRIRGMRLFVLIFQTIQMENNNVMLRLTTSLNPRLVSQYCQIVAKQ